MWRLIKISVNLTLTALIFNFFTLIQVLLLNPGVAVGSRDLLWLYLDLLAFYGPFWFIINGITFVIIQFFSERKYPIGVFHPPTLTYFMSFSILCSSFFMYLNYDYYINFFTSSIKVDFIKILLLHLVLIITGVIFIFYRKVRRNWLQVIFYSILGYTIFFSYTTAVQASRSVELESQTARAHGFLPQPFPPAAPEPREETEPPPPSETPETVSPVPGSAIDTPEAPKPPPPPRKIRVVIMDGLSLDLIQALASDQKLLNFNELIKNGASGKIIGYQPNLDLSLLHTALTGRKPSQFTPHSNTRFKFTNVAHEFDLRPRYLFFRKSSFLNLVSFFNVNDNNCLDFIEGNYTKRKLRTIRILRPEEIPIYWEDSLQRDKRFVPLFSDLLNRQDEKFGILRKAFFYDSHVMNRMHQHWKEHDSYYSVVRFPGLGIVTRYFYQYHQPEIVGGVPDYDIKKYGHIIEKYYEYYASIVGNLISTAGENEMLVILSFYEYEPLPVWRRILVNLTGRKDVFVYKSMQSQGSIFLYEKSALKKDYPLKDISIYDIYPTLLYYGGFQLSKDLEGEVIRELFTDEFVLNNPIDIDTSRGAGPIR